MGRHHIDGHLMLRYSDSPSYKYWKEISEAISAKYGQKKITDHHTVESVLLDSFQIIADKFKALIKAENSFKFFQYTFYLHEESIKIYKKHIFENLTIHPISGSEFAMYRRILKCILEQGCDLDLEWADFPSAEEVYKMDEKLQDLIYLGRWLYDLADSIALHKMVNSFHAIDFNANGEMLIDYQYHYRELYDGLFPQLEDDYKSATADEQSVQKLKDAIEHCFAIKYDYAVSIIFKIKEHFSTSELQTIQPHVLPQNLVHEFNIAAEDARLFYDGITISRANKMTLEDLIYKPYSMERYMFRPILVYKIGGEDRALVGREKFAESIFVTSTNAIHWNALSSEWKQNRCIEQFLSKMGNEHDKILEDEIESKIKAIDLLFVRNIKSFKRQKGDNININSAVAGEIDFIVINSRLKTVFVADSKYNRARYEVVGFRNDYSQFIQQYEPKLEKKSNWVRNNLQTVTEHFQIIYNLPDLDFTSYEVEGVFFINTPTFYMFNGKFKAITLNQLSRYLRGSLTFKSFAFLNKDPNSDNQYDIIKHPYFTK